ncbi:hypothetical protein [Herbaspirillum lusitanum]|uniref:hypothetical protein n=1 Tax=Herbaspirillum lusitanum TaxID=213312 RepID=UPI002238B44B|nr:hypothetical protein [Herbaspirillum lusitanum]
MALDFFAEAVDAAFAGELVALTAVAVALPVGFAAAVFFGTDRDTGVDLLAGLTAGLVFLAEGVGVFAVFFIASAIESKPSESNSLRHSNHAFPASHITWIRFARATFLNLSSPAFLVQCDGLFAFIRSMDRWFNESLPHHELCFAAELKPWIITYIGCFSRRSRQSCVTSSPDRPSTPLKIIRNRLP